MGEGGITGTRQAKAMYIYFEYTHQSYMAYHANEYYAMTS